VPRWWNIPRQSSSLYNYDKAGTACSPKTLGICKPLHENMIRAVFFDLGHTLMDELADRSIPLEDRPIELMPGVSEVLAQIRFPMGIWANTRTAREADIRRWLRRAGIEQYFTWVVTSVDAGSRKPNRQFFDYALCNCNLSGDEILFIGNQLNTDVLGAVNYGIRCVWLSDETYRSLDETYESAQVEATYTIRTLADLPDLLAKLEK
jgi:FMN phosphatase YigB (HAD superfamily)